MSRTMRARHSLSRVSSRNWIIIALLAVVVAALGGSSRSDAAQITALRPLVALFLIPALYYASRDAISHMRGPLFILAALAILMIAQLVPLPPFLWEGLPGRQEIAEMSRILVLDTEWRPLSLVPTRTLNALASLVVPATALLCLTVFGTDERTILWTIAAMGVANAGVSIAQTASGGYDLLYPYAVTNTGAAVGIFANQNHSAVFVSLTLLVIAYFLANSRLRRQPRWAQAVLSAAFLFVLLAALTGGSRTGLLATGLSLLASMGMIWLGLNTHSANHAALPRLLGRPIGPSMIVCALATLVLVISGLFAAMERLPALHEFTAQSSFDDLRWQLLPTFKAIINTYWITGAGFGSFEEVYHIFEPTDLMNSEYVNQAHNDWVQLIIEGGLPALVLGLSFVWWIVRQLQRIGWATRTALIDQLFWLTVGLIIVLASFVDYPLRTAIFQFSGVALALALARHSTGNAHRPDQT